MNEKEIIELLKSKIEESEINGENPDSTQFNDNYEGVLLSRNQAKAILKAIELSENKGVLLGLKICKEMWAQGTISHEQIRENEIYYSV